MTSVEYIKQICKEKNIPISRLERDLGFSNGYIRNMKKRTLSAERALKIAEYLQIPVEKLINPDAPYTAPESPGTPRNRTLNPVIMELLQNASEADIDDIQMASDMFKRLIAYKRTLAERGGS